jgi:predicted nicotinamide N-methyase
MDSQDQNIINISGVDLDEEFLGDLETDEITFSRCDGMYNQDVTLTYVTNSMEALNNKFPAPKYDADKDIVKNEYEGGFTVWEGTYDLINFLLHNGEKLDLVGKNILDLGCGHGLVGIFCLRAYTGSTVCFQDYNLDVLKFATIPNMIKNGIESKIAQCRFMSGDWGTLVDNIKNGVNDIVTPLHDKEAQMPAKFDAIFMSEVLYNSDNYNKLAQVIEGLLDSNGVCIIGSKLYYFGIGGSVDEFKEFMENNYPKFKVQTLQEINDKKSNKREIFAVGLN